MSQAGIISVAALPAVPTTFVTDTGNAIPALNVINVVTPGGGTQGITTTGAGNTITIKTFDLYGTTTTIGAVTGDVITFPLGATAGTYAFDVTVSAFDSATPSGAGYGIVAAVRTLGAGAAILMPNQAIDELEEVALIPANAEVTVDALNNAIVRVTGVAGLTIKWKASAKYVFAN